jgi:tetratricopeptide (TPR) repeat protein
MPWRLRALFIAVVLTACGVAPAPPAPNRVADARKLVDRGTVELRRGALDKAAASYQLALELNPFPAAFDGLGCVAFLRGEFALAERYFKGALAVSPSYSETLGNLALLYEAQGRRMEAEELFKAALNRDPRNYRARVNYAAFLVSANDRTLKESAYTELLKARAVVAHPITEMNISQIHAIDRSSYE